MSLQWMCATDVPAIIKWDPIYIGRIKEWKFIVIFIGFALKVVYCLGWCYILTPVTVLPLWKVLLPTQVSSFVAAVTMKSTSWSKQAGFWKCSKTDLTAGTFWMFPKIGGFPPKSSILIGFSIINRPFWGFSPYFWKHPFLGAMLGEAKGLEERITFWHSRLGCANLSFFSNSNGPRKLKVPAWEGICDVVCLSKVCTFIYISLYIYTYTYRLFKIFLTSLFNGVCCGLIVFFVHPFKSPRLQIQLPEVPRKLHPHPILSKQEAYYLNLMGVSKNRGYIPPQIIHGLKKGFFHDL